ncbi:MAG: hypothetical protein ACFWUA_05240 [Sporanaerobacter sp.]|jgi:hypothetical protein|uniref:hypothetical protein n=1 Tax=Sporanaerobacter sp. TaxID=2010183 RepID=UPI003A101C6D
MKYNSFSLKIEGQEVSTFIKDGSFRLTLDANYNNTCDFTLTRAIDSNIEGFAPPVLGQDVEITVIYNNITIIKSIGIITRINKRKIEAGLGIDKKLEFNITCSAYNTIPSRRVVATEKVYDNVYAGDIVKELLTEYLVAEGISAEIDYIDNGLQLLEYDIFANTKTVAEVLDDLASQSHYIWYIDYNKKLVFKNTYAETIMYRKNLITETTDIEFLEAEIEETTDDYRNRQIVVGGLGDDGYIVQSIKEDIEEISKMKTQTGGTGIWEVIENATDIDLQEKADAKAEFLLNKYGKIKTEMTVTILYPVKPGGLISVNLPTLGIDYNRYFVETVNISDFAPDELLFELKLVHKKIFEEEDLPIILDTEDEFTDYFKEKFGKIENLTNQKVTEEFQKIDSSIVNVVISDGGMVIIRRDGSQTSLSFTKDGENRITNITNNNNGKSIGIGWSE